MIVTRSTLGHSETVDALLAALEQRSITVFARIDHAAGAREAGMELPPQDVVVFGNPRAGTPLMQSDPRVGIELPLRILVWQADDGVLVGYSDPRELSGGYDLDGQEAVLEQMARLLQRLAEEAAG
jgi:uncharacterized protein (DUF302 family)